MAWYCGEVKGEVEMCKMKTFIMIWSIGVGMATGVLYGFDQMNISRPSAVIQSNPDNYCAKMQDGKMVVMHNGVVLTADVFLKNGTTIKPDGTVITRDGVRTSLKEGECIDADGKINHIKVSEPYQKEE
jgi:hypothetical protein